MGTLSYAYGITLIAPSIGVLNEMLILCDNFANLYNVMFNSKETFCIKFSNEVIRNEAVFLYNQPLKWSEKVCHIYVTQNMFCWNKADWKEIENYKINLERNLLYINIPHDCITYTNYLCNNVEHLQRIQIFHDELIAACISASSAIPDTSNNKNKGNVSSI